MDYLLLQNAPHPLKTQIKILKLSMGALSVRKLTENFNMNRNPLYC